MVVSNPTGDPDCRKPQYSVKFEERRVEDLAFEYPRQAFERVRRLSDANEAFYRTFVAPWVQAATTPWSAAVLKWLHPMRTSRYLWSERFLPWMGAFAVLADAVSKSRHALAEDHPLLAQDAQDAGLEAFQPGTAQSSNENGFAILTGGDRQAVDAHFAVAGAMAI